MSDQTPTPDSTDDVAGHMPGIRKSIATEPTGDDVEGHKFSRKVVEDGEDVEGHGFRRNVVDDGEAEDDKTPGTRPKI